MQFVPRTMVPNLRLKCSKLTPLCAFSHFITLYKLRWTAYWKGKKIDCFWFQTYARVCNIHGALASASLGNYSGHRVRHSQIGCCRYGSGVNSMNNGAKLAICLGIFFPRHCRNAARLLWCMQTLNALKTNLMHQAPRPHPWNAATETDSMFDSVAIRNNVKISLPLGEKKS